MSCSELLRAPCFNALHFEIYLFARHTNNVTSCRTGKALRVYKTNINQCTIFAKILHIYECCSSCQKHFTGKIIKWLQVKVGVINSDYCAERLTAHKHWPTQYFAPCWSWVLGFLETAHDTLVSPNKAQRFFLSSSRPFLERQRANRDLGQLNPRVNGCVCILSCGGVILTGAEWGSLV